MIFYTGSATAPVVIGEVTNGQQRVSVRQDGVSHNLLSTPAQTDEFIKERNKIENKRKNFNKFAAIGLTLVGGGIGYAKSGKAKVNKAVATGIGAIIGLLTSTATATAATLIANQHQRTITGKFIEQNQQ